MMRSALQLLGCFSLAIGTGAVDPSYFGTLPYSDEKVASPQKVPGKVWLAWFDEGGPGKATLTYDNVNHGSCQLNPCEGVNATYLNTFRKDEGISVSYTKKEFWYIGKKWADRWASDKTLVPLDEFYVGWLMLNNWFRITLDVQKTGDYTSDIYFTCPFGGKLNFTLSNYATGAIVDEQIVDMPVTTYFHDWAILEKGVAFKNVPEGWNVLTITIADVGEDKKIHFGNFIWLDFKPLEL